MAAQLPLPSVRIETVRGRDIQPDDHLVLPWGIARVLAVGPCPKRGAEFVRIATHSHADAEANLESGAPLVFSARGERQRLVFEPSASRLRPDEVVILDQAVAGLETLTAHHGLGADIPLDDRLRRQQQMKRARAIVNRLLAAPLEHGNDCPTCPPDEEGRPACPPRSYRERVEDALAVSTDSDEARGTQISDLLADLMLFSQFLGYDWAALLDRADTHATAEGFQS